MRLPSLLRPGRRAAELETEVDRLRAQVDDGKASLALMAEDIGALERQLLEPGWIRAVHQLKVEFSQEFLVHLRAVCTLYAIKNPLIKRGLTLRTAYVWGKDVEVTARADGSKKGQQNVSEVIQAFWDNPGNQNSLTGVQARAELEQSGFGCEGEIFCALFTSPMTGSVRARTITADEIVDVITNPDDSGESWFYVRRWEEDQGDGSYVQHEALYPDIDHKPTMRLPAYNGLPVRWDSPILHVAVNRPKGWKRGIPDAYAAVDWAKAYKNFLEDWATLMRALAQYAYQAQVPGDKAGAMRRRINEARPGRSAVSGEPTMAGSTMLMSPEVALQAVSKTGATFDSESGKPLASMTAAALDVPVTQLLADPGVTGARATAETLQQPTELPMDHRRLLWEATFQRIHRYIITESVRAPRGKLKGRITTDEYGVERVELDGSTPVEVDMAWPSMDEGDLAKVVDAIQKGAATRVMPPALILRLLGNALRVRNIDQIIEDLTDENGEFKWPAVPPVGPDQNGPAALARRGGDPADAGPGGRMGSAPKPAGAGGKTSSSDR